MYFSLNVKILPGKFCRKVVNMHVSCANHLLITEIFSEKLKVLYEAFTFPAFTCFLNKMGVNNWYGVVYETYADCCFIYVTQTVLCQQSRYRIRPSTNKSGEVQCLVIMLEKPERK